MNLHGKRKGFSLTELVIVLLILGVLGAIGIGVGSKQIASSRISSISNNIKLVGSEVENAIVDLGFLESIDDEAEVVTYFKSWHKKYLTPNINTDTMTIVPVGGRFGTDYSGVAIVTEKYQDPWENDVHIFYMIPTTGDMYRIVIASAGPNSVFADDAETGYLNGAFDDDIVMVMEPRYIDG